MNKSAVVIFVLCSLLLIGNVAFAVSNFVSGDVVGGIFNGSVALLLVVAISTIRLTD